MIFHVIFRSRASLRTASKSTSSRPANRIPNQRGIQFAGQLSIGNANVTEISRLGRSEHGRRIRIGLIPQQMRDEVPSEPRCDSATRNGCQLGESESSWNRQTWERHGDRFIVSFDRSFSIGHSRISRFQFGLKRLRDHCRTHECAEFSYLDNA